ncbi:MAG TPA: hypothetical protein VNO70_19170 [Blastocatellia bacterium]|nr:hypothetical protein [Blastocatellia bacterium]
MKLLATIFMSLLTFATLPADAAALPGAQAALSPEEALKRAAANEEKLRAAERGFTYRQDILVQTLGEARSIRGQMRRVSEVSYDDKGNRQEKIIEFPHSRLNAFLGIMVPDYKSLVGVDPFFLTPEALPRYTIKFVERQKVDELNTYVYDVEPKNPSTKRKEGDDWPFKGRIWVDDQDLQIVKLEGKALTGKEDRERFPKFECYREYVDGKFWLPSMVYADDVLDFKDYDLPIRMQIKYTDYKRIKQDG